MDTEPEKKQEELRRRTETFTEMLKASCYRIWKGLRSLSHGRSSAVASEWKWFLLPVRCQDYRVSPGKPAWGPEWERDRERK